MWLRHKEVLLTVINTRTGQNSRGYAHIDSKRMAMLSCVWQNTLGAPVVSCRAVPDIDLLCHGSTPSLLVGM